MAWWDSPDDREGVPFAVDAQGIWREVPEESLPVAGATFLSLGGADAAIDRPEILIPTKIAIHLLSFRKTYQQLRAARFTGNTAVLGINLRVYAQRWWQVCDEQKEKHIAAALQATALLREWLAEDISGRGWFYHPQVEAERARLAARQKEEAARQAQRMMEAWTAPSLKRHPLAHRAIPFAAEQTAMPFEFMKPVRSEVRIVLTDEHAMEVGLLWHANLRRWYCVVPAGEVAPSECRDLLASDGPWEPVLEGERQYLLTRPPRTTIARESRPPVEATPSPGQARVNQEPVEDIILNTGVGTCWCGAMRNEVQFASGFYGGRRGIRCSVNPKHPFSVSPL